MPPHPRSPAWKEGFVGQGGLRLAGWATSAGCVSGRGALSSLPAAARRLRTPGVALAARVASRTGAPWAGRGHAVDRQCGARGRGPGAGGRVRPVAMAGSQQGPAGGAAAESPHHRPPGRSAGVEPRPLPPRADVSPAGRHRRRRPPSGQHSPGSAWPEREWRGRGLRLLCAGDACPVHQDMVREGSAASREKRRVVTVTLAAPELSLAGRGLPVPARHRPGRGRAWTAGLCGHTPAPSCPCGDTRLHCPPSAGG